MSRNNNPTTLRRTTTHVVLFQKATLYRRHNVFGNHFLDQVARRGKVSFAVRLDQGYEREREQSAFESVRVPHDRALTCGKMDRSARTTKVNVARMLLIRFASAQQDIGGFGVENNVLFCGSQQRSGTAAAAITTQPIVITAACCHHHPAADRCCWTFRNGQADRLDSSSSSSSSSHIHLARARFE
jgi:hypothetical protein